ncbi:aldehyde dehydrogenase family protein [Streptomyces winkii]|uniref:aldehyde dehydrogenase family protein n=1 Tax=Streptomyces winkii TaxID=3051178 RepID=UPI0028D0208C|nr:aldehyde dehydrogenase family protein [Streptomyces sp. DSM 40971]
MGTTPSPSSLPPPTPPAPPTLTLKPGKAWADAWRRCRETAPEAFTADGRLNSLRHGGWHGGGEAPPATSPVDGTPVAAAPALDAATARDAVSDALARHRAWRHVALPERCARVAAALDALAEHRALLALLLVWETGAPWRHAQADVDRAVDGVRDHVGTIGTALRGRTCLPGPVENVTGPHHPVSDLVHAMLVEALAGNAVIARTPDEGGAACVSLACALSVREGLPFTLVSGPPRRGDGEETAPATAQAQVSRHSLEREEPARWGLWEYSDWEQLTHLLRAAYGGAAHCGGRRPCAAGARFAVQRSLLDDFLGAYLPAVRSARYGHPLAVASPEEPLPDLDFGPLSSAGTAAELSGLVRDAVGRGAVPVHRGSLAEGRFLPGQDTSAYLAPTVLLLPSPSAAPPRSAQAYGPVDSIVAVDTEEELLAAMNSGHGGTCTGAATTGAATLCTDDRNVFDRLAPRVRAAGTAHNGPRPRGGREEHSGGEALVRAVTDGPSGESTSGGPGDRRSRAGTDPSGRRLDRPPGRAARRKPRRAARSPGITEVKSAAGAWYGCPRRHGRAGRRPLSGWRNGRRASLRC